MDALCASPQGSEWLVAVGDLHCAVRRPQPATEHTHMYNLDELAWSGVSIVPPEVVTISSSSYRSKSKSLDCSLVDSFAVGCLIYGMMGEPHPFEDNPRLLSQDYIQKDLPMFSTDPSSVRSATLQWLAHQFLMRDPKSRMTIHSGLTLCQALLWLPPEWFQGLVPANTFQHFLAYERAALVCALAKQKAVTLGNLLKMQFLLDTTSTELSHTLSLVWHC